MLVNIVNNIENYIHLTMLKMIMLKLHTLYYLIMLKITYILLLFNIINNVEIAYILLFNDVNNVENDSVEN